MNMTRPLCLIAACAVLAGCGSSEEPAAAVTSAPTPPTPAPERQHETSPPAAAGAAGSSDDPQPQSIAQAAIDRNARIVFMRKLQHIDPSLARQCVANAP